MLALLGLTAAGGTLLVLAASGGGQTGRAPAPEASWRGLVGSDRAAVPVGQRMIVVLTTPSVADHLRKQRFATESEERRWSSEALAAQQQLLTMLAANGVGVQPDYSFTRVLNGFAAALDPRAISLLQREREVRGIYPVRAAYPATVSSSLLESKQFARGEGRRPDVDLPGSLGRGVTIALLDTGVERSQPYLHDRVLRGIDLVDGRNSAAATKDPQDPGRRERHGTQLAGLLVGSGGPGGLRGVAPGATLLPIRIAGWQPDAGGTYAVYSRSDQLIAGLDRAVDPNGDGDAHDAARVALVGVAEPYAAFTTGPEALAVGGAVALDTLVVAPAGNDGAAGPAFGSVSGPGGAPAAVTVAATDARAETPSARVVLRRGLQVIHDRVEPLLGPVTPPGALTVDVGAPRAVPRSGGSSTVDFFDSRGLSLVAGRAAVVPTGGDAAAAARAAVRAGASAVLLYGESLPAGALGLSDETAVPVVTIPSGAALALLAARDLGTSVGVSIAPHDDLANATSGGVASFSSRGLAFDGGVKPNVAAAGVGLATSDVGTDSDGEPAYATVNGTSAAAASVAGAAALLAEARPALAATALRSLIGGYARREADAAVTATGAGTLDVGSSAVGEVVADETSLAFGRRTGAGWTKNRTLTLRNVSSRRLALSITPRQTSGEGEHLQLTAKPTHLLLRVGRSARVTITARAPSVPRDPVAAGIVEVVPDGGRALRVPWAVAFRQSSGSLLARVRLRTAKFKPSDTAPAVLNVQAGRLLDDAGIQVEPVSRRPDALFVGGDRALRQSASFSSPIVSAPCDPMASGTREVARPVG